MTEKGIVDLYSIYFAARRYRVYRRVKNTGIGIGERLQSTKEDGNREGTFAFVYTKDDVTFGYVPGEQ